MGKMALKIWENQYEIIKKIPQKKLQEKLSLAILDYAFTGKHDKLEFPLDAIIQGMYIGLTLKNQGGAPTGNNNNRYKKENTTVVQPLYECCKKNNTTEEQPLLENRKKKEEIENKTSEDVLQKKRTKKFTPPSFEEVKTYLAERGNLVDAQKFYDYFSVSNWHDSEGKPVKNWKQKAITWESKERTLNAAKCLVRAEDYKPLSWL